MVSSVSSVKLYLPELRSEAFELGIRVRRLLRGEFESLAELVDLLVGAEDVVLTTTTNV